MSSFINYGLNTTNIGTKMLNQSIKCLPLVKIKNIVISLLVATLIPVPLQSAAPSPHSGGSPSDTFSILLSGPYQAVPEKPIADCPDLGLFQANICDGSYSKTKIFPVSGLPKEASGQANSGEGPRSGERQAENAIGTFYVQFVGIHAVYDLPGGAMTMFFTANNLVPAPDGQGGTYFVGTVDLDIVEATGIFESFVGGHNKMVDILHQLADGTFVEHCFCVISRPQQSAAITPHAFQVETGDRRFDREDATV